MLPGPVEKALSRPGHTGIHPALIRISQKRPISSIFQGLTISVSSAAMTKTFAACLPDKEIEQIVTILETADDNHRAWLRALHSSMICGKPFDADVFSHDAHTRCRFGQWYYNDIPHLLQHRPDFIALDEMHKLMHDAARSIAGKSSRGESIPPEEYDDFINRQRIFSKHLLCLRDQMRECLLSFDSLTGVMTRRPFDQILHAESSRAERTGEPCCLALMDIDHFKSVNDNHGHIAGDRVLRNVAQFLVHQLRPYDSICRYGGEEFLICLPATELEQASAIMDRERMELEAHDIEYEQDQYLRVTASVGVACLSTTDGYEDCLREADDALYRAKNRGRNQVCIGGGKQSRHRG